MSGDVSAGDFRNVGVSGRRPSQRCGSNIAVTQIADLVHALVMQVWLGRAISCVWTLILAGPCLDVGRYGGHAHTVLVVSMVDMITQ